MQPPTSLADGDTAGAPPQPKSQPTVRFNPESDGPTFKMWDGPDQEDDDEAEEEVKEDRRCVDQSVGRSVGLAHTHTHKHPPPPPTYTYTFHTKASVVRSARTDERGCEGGCGCRCRC